MIIEYEEKYLEDVKDLLVELEEYLVSIDKDNLDQIHEDYREKYANIELNELEKKNGKCFIAVENNKAVGLVMGEIREYSEYDYLDYKCPKTGDIIELIVSSKYRKKGYGNQLINKMEDYFKEQECEIITIDVFAYNEKAICFYDKKGYHNRMHRIIKSIKQ